MATTDNAVRERGTIIHVTVDAAMNAKIERMAADDRRKYKAEWIRLLIEDEWNRRNAGNGHKP